MTVTRGGKILTALVVEVFSHEKLVNHLGYYTMHYGVIAMAASGSGLRCDKISLVERMESKD